MNFWCDKCNQLLKLVRNHIFMMCFHERILFSLQIFVNQENFGKLPQVSKEIFEMILSTAINFCLHTVTK